MKNNIKVSIITVVFNGSKHIEQTINSVLSLNYDNLEYIIIDGGSSDGTVDIIKKYEDKLAYWVSEPDNGIYDAMNKGIKRSNGELIGIINSDDWYEPNAIKEAVSLYDGLTVVYGLLKFIRNDHIEKIYAPSPCLIKSEMIPHPACFIPRRIYDSFGLYDLQYKSCADYHLILRLLQNHITFKLIEKPLANFRLGGFSWNVNSLCESYKMRYKMGVISKYEYLIKSYLLRLTNGRILKILGKY